MLRCAIDVQMIKRMLMVKRFRRMALWSERAARRPEGVNVKELG